MKIFLYFVLIIAFLLFYQQNPFYAALMVALLIGLILFFKLRRRNGNFGRGIFFGGKYDKLDKRFDDLMLLILLQQVLHSPPESTPKKNKPQNSNIPKKDTIITSNEILALLKE